MIQSCEECLSCLNCSGWKGWLSYILDCITGISIALHCVSHTPTQDSQTATDEGDELQKLLQRYV